MHSTTPGADILRQLGFAAHDDHHLTESFAKFDDGTDFRIEVPAVNSSATFSGILRRARRQGVFINRATETLGLFRHTGRELRDYLSLARDEGVAMYFSAGPPAAYDTGSQRGAPAGDRLRGVDQLRNALDDVLRGIDLGCRNFVVYDEGLLHILSLARSRRRIPAEVRFKAPAHLGYANAAGVRLLAGLGADSVTPVTGLPTAAVAAMRQAVDVPLDLHTGNPPGSGGFVPTYETPDLVRVARPVHLMPGDPAVTAPDAVTDHADGERMADQAAIVVETLQRLAPELRQSPAGTETPPAAGPRLPVNGAAGGRPLTVSPLIDQDKGLGPVKDGGLRPAGDKPYA
ncbi:peptidase [Streptomyces sp. XD-27]|uniref:peptidase n=1 Tax=Streptomyces sp. XD-27 TaxID=3062779 RepID=UPI0026F44A3A|nr:peptidase [Streptomyces sp. XD-27]WKX69148.1 peptidase [Streptomyces sp. XD-27]